MQKAQKGFTLVELIVVIVLLGILGVTALGKFQDLSDDAGQAAVTGVASELSSASAINYANSVIDAGHTDILNAAGACATTTLNALFQNNTWPTGYTVAASGADNCLTAAAGTAVTCTVTHTASTNTADASIICDD